MNEYRIFKWLGKEFPGNYDYMFFSFDAGRFFQHLCTLIIDGFSYSLEGPDEEAKEHFEKKLYAWDNALPIPFHGKSEGMRWDGDERVPIGDDRFSSAVDYTADLGDYIYCSDRYKLVEVHSREEAEKLIAQRELDLHNRRKQVA